MDRERAERFRRRQVEIVDIAARLFAARGYAGTGIAELSSNTGLKRGALYYYIKSKEQLLVQINGRVMDRLEVTTASVLDQDLDPEAQLRALARGFVDVVSTFRDHVWVTLHEWRALTGTNAEVFRRRRHAYEEVVADTLRAGVDSGDFDVEDVPTAVLAWLGMFNYIYQWYDPKNATELNSATIADRFTAIFLHGVVRTPVTP